MSKHRGEKQTLKICFLYTGDTLKTGSRTKFGMVGPLVQTVDPIIHGVLYKYNFWNHKVFEIHGQKPLQVLATSGFGHVRMVT